MIGRDLVTPANRNPMIGRDLVTPANRNPLLSLVEEDGAAERAADTTALYFSMIGRVKPRQYESFPVSERRRRSCRTHSWYYPYCTCITPYLWLVETVVTPANRNPSLSQVEEDGPAERAADITTVLNFTPYLWLVELGPTPANRNPLLSQVEEDGAAERAAGSAAGPHPQEDQPAQAEGQGSHLPLTQGGTVMSHVSKWRH